VGRLFIVLDVAKRRSIGVEWMPLWGWAEQKALYALSQGMVEFIVNQCLSARKHHDRIAGHGADHNSDDLNAPLEQTQDIINFAERYLTSHETQLRGARDPEIKGQRFCRLFKKKQVRSVLEITNSQRHGAVLTRIFSNPATGKLLPDRTIYYSRDTFSYCILAFSSNHSIKLMKVRVWDLDSFTSKP
jgi:hypothetical protein